MCQPPRLSQQQIASYFVNYWHFFFELCVSVKINLGWKMNSLFFSPLLSSSCDRPPVFSHINHLETFFKGCPDELEGPFPLPPRRHAPPGRRPSLASPALGWIWQKGSAVWSQGPRMGRRQVETPGSGVQRIHRGRGEVPGLPGPAADHSDAGLAHRHPTPAASKKQNSGRACVLERVNR